MGTYRRRYSKYAKIYTVIHITCSCNFLEFCCGSLAYRPLFAIKKWLNWLNWLWSRRWIGWCWFEVCRGLKIRLWRRGVRSCGILFWGLLPINSVKGFRPNFVLLVSSSRPPVTLSGASSVLCKTYVCDASVHQQRGFRCAFLLLNVVWFISTF